MSHETVRDVKAGSVKKLSLHMGGGHLELTWLPRGGDIEAQS